MAEAFKVFEQTKRKLGEGSLDLTSGVFKLVIVKSAAVLCSANSSLSTWASLKTQGVTELTPAGNYAASGNAVTVTWTLSKAGGGGVCRFDATNWSLSANAVNHSAIRQAVIHKAGVLVCFASLSTAKFDVLDENKLIIQFHTSGIFELT